MQRNGVFMSILRKFSIMLGLSVLSASTLAAGSLYTGKVKVHCNADLNHCNVNILGTAQGVPSCVGNPNWYVFKMDSPVWKEQLSIALAAQAADRNVEIGGSGSCSQRPGVHEDLSTITLAE